MGSLQPDSSNSNPRDPSVLKGAGKVVFKDSHIRSGAFSAVGRTQDVPVNTPLDRGTLDRHLAISQRPTKAKTIPDPSVLSSFQGAKLPKAKYGAGSFSAVGGNRTLRTSTLPSIASIQSKDTIVLAEQRRLPPPDKEAYADGAHSAVAGHRGTHKHGPKVLDRASGFEIRNSVIEEGGFSAVSEDQEMTYQGNPSLPPKSSRSR